jgi:hypothetical protein
MTNALKRVTDRRYLVPATSEAATPGTPLSLGGSQKATMRAAVRYEIRGLAPGAVVDGLMPADSAEAAASPGAMGSPTARAGERVSMPLGPGRKPRRHHGHRPAAR